MSLLRRLFSSAYRRARRAEAKGDYREAAAIYAAADMPEDAANALLFHAVRAKDVSERLEAYHDALRWLPEDHARRPEVEAQIGLAVLEGAQQRGAHTAEEKRRLRDAAARLEFADRDAEAATAYEILGQNEDVARCLQKAGEVERLEALLDETAKAAAVDRQLRQCVGEYEMSMAVGARVEAKRALQRALDVVPKDRAVSDLLRRLEARELGGRRVLLRINGREVVFVGRDEVVVGREADVVMRGASVSRRHTQLSVVDDDILVRDLDSRNGTLVQGLPIRGELRAQGATELGLGDDVTIRVQINRGAMEIRVIEGLDRGQEVIVGRGGLRSAGLPVSITFPDGRATLTPDGEAQAQLGSQDVAAPVTLLRNDVLEIDGVKVEVVS